MGAPIPGENRSASFAARCLAAWERAEPNQLWQMDFKGPKGWDQPVGPLSLLDDHSRYALALENTGSTQARSVQAVMDQDVSLRFSGYQHPQTQGKVERFHRSLTAALLRRGYNCVRPHEALQMKTPDQVWHKSPRMFRVSQSAWQYPEASEVKQVDRNGQFRLHHQRHYITQALAGKQVGLLEVEHRILVFYRRTLICELDSMQPRSMTAPAPATSADRV